MTSSCELPPPLSLEQYQLLEGDVAKCSVLLAPSEIDAMVAELDATIPPSTQMKLIKAILVPEAYSAFLLVMLHKPKGKCQHAYAEFKQRDYLAQKLRAGGLQVTTEVQMPISGICDIVVWANELPKQLIEVKIADPIRAVGQLLAYGEQWYPRPTLVLATTVYDELCVLACKSAGIEFWKL